MKHECAERNPDCLCNTCQNDVGACCLEHGTEPAPGGCIITRCPDYYAEPTGGTEEEE